MGDADPKEGLNQPECREPTLQDLLQLCRALNKAGAHYLVIGGFAMRAAGYTRQTMDVDLLVEMGVENEARVIEGLLSLPDQAAHEVRPGDIQEFGVVRVADEILVDLMKQGCGIDYTEAVKDAILHKIEDVEIPFASPKTLLRMKQTVREKDIADRLFLNQLIAREQNAQESTKPRTSWLSRLFRKGT